jgi:hypothetical protein
MIGYKKWAKIGSLSMLLGLSSCSTDSLKDSELNSIKAEKEWTFLVFLNGDNNLDTFGTADMAEMSAIGSTDKVNIVVLRDTANASTSSKIYYMEKGKQTVVKDYGKNIDMGDYNNLVAFYQYVKTNYPAKHFFVDVWNHGSGWNFTQTNKGISYDDNSGNHITTKQLGTALSQMKAINGKNIDVYGSDACLMQMMEVAYEVKDSVDIYAGSEETEPGDGWDYKAVLAPLIANPLMSGQELSGILAKSYVASYSGGSQGTSDATFSIVSTAKLTNAMPVFNAYVDELIRITPSNKSALNVAVSGSQAYAYPDNKDFIHFINNTKKSITDSKYLAAADALLNELGKNVIVNNYSTGSAVSNSFGLAMWIPTESSYSSQSGLYKTLAFSQNSKWTTFIEGLYGSVSTDPVGTVVSYSLESAHPYANNANQSWVIQKAGAKSIQIHFSAFDTEKGYDYVSLYDKANNLIAKLDGTHNNYWTDAIAGDYVKVVLTSDSSVTKNGFTVDKIAY